MANAPTTRPHFYPLVVAEVRRETPSAVSIAFAIPDALRPQYRFKAGQHLTLRTRLGSQEVRRSYSICAGIDDTELRIAVKRQEGGIFSAWIHDSVKAGDVMEVLTPTGRFILEPEPDHPRLHAAFVAGSGITPVLSIMKTVLAREPASHFFLFYGSRSTNEILFHEAIEDLKDRYINRLSVFYVLSRERQDLDILNGRLDRAKATLLLAKALPGCPVGQAYVCGPFGMIADAEAALLDSGARPDQIHIERFTSALAGRPRPPQPVAAQAPHAIAAIIRDGVCTEVPVAEGEAVLDAALRAGLDMPYACKGGMCSTCRARVVEGTTDMEVNYALQPWEIEAGFVLTCQARPKSNFILIDYDWQ
ncbi:MAG: 2Fe-2S iron-sulfur cluster binding domain-containing protein [Acetobacteraceae bacterium]|nr:2Fe-2S iron-sulfur cluster binding domain-containing protein [Acetobacteraceae bacterium]